MNEFVKKNKLFLILLLFFSSAVASINFSNSSSKFILNDWQAKIRVNPSSVQGWRDSSIVQKVSGYGLGDYNLKYYDYIPDNTITYSELSNSMQYSDWNIPANTAVHIRENLYMDGYGGTINLGENSQLFVDDNVTLTLRNVTINSSKNLLTNSPIKLASPSSKLALDNVKIDASSDFYFDRGSLFVHNDVKFTGTSAFIYRSCQPSFITSGANLIFDTGTTFSFVPATYTTCPYTVSRTYTANDFIKMTDKTSKIIFNGADFRTTLTGLMLTVGEVNFGNKVNIQSKSTRNISTTITDATVWSSSSGISGPWGAIWSPDGRFVAVTNFTGGTLQIFSFTGASNPTLIGSVATGSNPNLGTWSPDGRFIAVANNGSGTLQVFRFAGSGSPVSVGSILTGGGPISAKWSPDGRFIAMGTSGTTAFYVFRFTGSGAPVLVGTGTVASAAYSLDWSPDGRFIAVVCPTPATLQIFSFTGSGNPVQVGPSVTTGASPQSVNWSPDGRFVAVTKTGDFTLQIFRFTGVGSLISVGSVSTVTTSRSVNWSPDGQFLAVANYGGSTLRIFKFTGTGNPTPVGSVSTGTSPYNVNWSPDGRFVAVSNNSGNSLQIFKINYITDVRRQAVSNSIVLGNSALQPISLSTKVTSTYDVTVKLLSGANVSVDGILNIDNSQTNTNSVIFSNDNARFVLNNSNSKIRINPSTILGWRDSSIVPNVSGIGLGDYNLKQYDYVPDNTITYSDVSNSMQFMDWNIPANTAVHIRDNIYMDGYGGTINLGENSQLFVDDNVTLTLRNVTVSSSKNGPGNPPIKLASARSNLTLDGVKLDFLDPFYFDRGNLFVNNDVKFTGTNSFIYRSCQPSFITSGAKLIFDTGTTFSFAPATYTVCPYNVNATYTTSDFIKMADQTSKLVFDGSNFYTTPTGLRLTTGEVDFDNKVNLDSNTTNSIAGIPATLMGSIPTGTNPQSLDWSPDGRFFAVVNSTTPVLQIFRFVENGNPVSVGTVPVGTNPWCVNWSPDGKFLAVVNYSTPSLQIFSFTGSGTPTLLSTVATSAGPISVNWSPDGRYLAVAYDTASLLQVFRFSGTGNPVLVSSIAAGTNPYSVEWSPDGKFLVVPGYSGTFLLMVFSFSESGGLTLIGSRAAGANSRSASWSPDGRFIAVTNWTSNTLQIFRFRGTGNPTSVGSVSTETNPISARWSPDGKYLAVAVSGSARLKIFKFNWEAAPTAMGSVATGAATWYLNYSRNGQLVAVINRTTSTLQIFRVNYINNRDTQLISNSIVFGNSSLQPQSLSTKLTSTYDCTLKLLSGANVSVNGLLNIDNSPTNTNSVIFSSDNSRFVLKDWRSKIRSNLNSMLGWHDSSIVPSVSGIGLGDYNLKQADFNFDNIITYSNVTNNMGAIDWNIPANESVHIRENIYMDGYGGTINLGENSQLFVDDNVTLTLRNVTVSSSKNGAGNPAIKLASARSKLTLDGVKLDFSDPFYFDRGNLFVNNDVKFTGTNSFIYRSCQPSFITSGANLIFDTGTTFSFAPATYTVCPYTVSRTFTTNDFIKMADQTSKLILNGADFRTTLTGLRFTAGEIDFDNKVNIQSKSAGNIPTTITASTVWSVSSGSGSQSVSWSPDGRFVAVVNQVTSGLRIFRFTGSGNPVLVGSATTGGNTTCVDWSSDGKFVAVVDRAVDTLQIFRVSVSGSLTFIGSGATGTDPYSVNWSPDGRFLAVVGTAAELRIFSFTGNSNPVLVGSTSSSGRNSVHWSPDGRFLATVNYNSNRLQIFSFTGSGNPVQVGSTVSGAFFAVNWSPDGRYVAAVDYTLNFLRIYRFTGNGNLILVGSGGTGTNPYSVNWSSDGRFLAVPIYNGGSGNTFQIFNFSGAGNPTLVGSATTGTAPQSAEWSSDGRFVAVVNFTSGTLQIFTINYINDVRQQAISNSIVLGNSSLQPLSLSTKLTSTYDCKVKLLSGANVSVDGILNIDNSQTNTNSVIFSSDNARFVLNNSNSKIRMNPSTVFGWRESSIVPNVSGIGLGDYNLKQYDYVPDNTITYSDVSNSMQYYDWNIPANTAVHIRENIYMDGYGGTINLGENSQLFVDDNVTLTLRNVNVSSSKNGVGNPAIKLASTRSKLALDNVKLDFANDFYFDRGQLFVYNDVNFTGTNGFIYRSTVPSYIKSGANLKFNQGTTFDYRPSTTGTPGMLAKDLLIMDDVTSKMTIDGATLKTTLTGMRLATGQVLFDNQVSLTSQSQFAFKNLGSLIPQNYGNVVSSVNWSPDGRFLAVGGAVPASTKEIQIYRINGSALSLVASEAYGTYVYSVNWSPDGKYLAVGGWVPTSGNEIQVYRFTGTSLSLVASMDFGVHVESVNWSPDGRYLAVGGNGPTSGNEIQVYSFNGLALSLVTSLNYGSIVSSVNWSPDGKYLAVGGYIPASGKEVQVYMFTGSALSLVASRDFGNSVYSVNWSPDGRYLAVGGYNSTIPGNEIQIYRFTGSALAIVASQGYGTYVYSVNWSPDGRYLAVGGNSPTSLNEIQVYKFTGSSLTLIDSLNYGTTVRSVNWSADGRYLAVGGLTPDSGHQEIDVYTLYYGPETQTQSLSESIVLGNSSSGSTSDITLKLLSGSNVSVDGMMNYDNTQGYTIFSSDNSRFILKDINSKIRLNPNTVVGWRDRSLVKNSVGMGQGDYNLLNYDTVPPTKIIGYSEAAGELVYDNSNTILYCLTAPLTLPTNNSNAITYLGRNVRTYSNSLTSWARQTSNAVTAYWRNIAGNSNSIVSWIKQTSNATIGIDRRVKWNSNAIIKLGSDTRNNSNAIIKVDRDARSNSNAVVYQNRRIRTNSNAIKFEADHFISVNNGKVTASAGITGASNVAGRGFLNSPIDLQGGTLTLNSDMILSNQTTIASSGNFDLQGNSMIFGGDLTLPSNVAIKIVSSGVIDGQGNEFKQAIGSKLIVDNNVTLTLRNMNWLASGSPQIEMRTATSRLALQSLCTRFDRDYSFTQGKLFIQDDVFVTGTSKFSYVSTDTSYIAPHSTLYFDKNTTFSFSPRVTSRHTRSERNLIKLLDKTAEIYFNSCVLQLPDSGWQLTKGTIYFDDMVTVYGNTTQADSFEWGDGVASGNDLEIKILSGGSLNNYAYIYHNPAS